MDMLNVKEILEKYGALPKKSLGQNFLVNPAVAEKTARLSLCGSSGGVIEIGPGLGALTLELCKIYRKVAAVEIDRAFEPRLRGLGLDNLSLVFADFLKLSLRELIEREFAGSPVNICANLPYYITTPVILKIIREPAGLNAVTVMLQKEAADKLRAAPGSANYCETSALVSYFGEAKKLFDVPRSNFYPQPKVLSSVVQIIPRRVCAPENEPLLFKIIGAAFAQRRKTLVNAIASQLNLDKRETAKIVQKITGDENIRGESVSIQKFSEISDLINLILGG